MHLLQFTYNNIIHSATRKSPFEVVHGKNVSMTMDSEVEATNDFVIDFDEICQQVKKTYSCKEQQNMLKVLV